uniref:NAD(P)-binding domain-containing protein n=1 Tax=Bionectria ochroleuca TaxID=29856 RepID=A0A8H7MYD6_BIOOC
MPRNVCISAADGNTGFAIADLLLSEPFSTKIDSLTALALDPTSSKAKELESHEEDAAGHRMRHHLSYPPAHKDKHNISVELITAAKKSGISNVLLVSSVGCDYADPKTQPHLREFIELENLTLASKGDASTELGHSPCVIRAGFYAENLLLYAPQAKSEGVLPLPIGKNHKFAPVALGDVAFVAAQVLSGKGEHGFDDRHRGQMMVVTGPMLCAGKELAEAASQALGSELEFEDISEAEAKRVLKRQSESDDSEQQYILEYYSLVREGKTNYISTTAFHDVTGEHATEPSNFFKLYSGEFKRENGNKRQKRHH